MCFTLNSSGQSSPNVVYPCIIFISGISAFSDFYTTWLGLVFPKVVSAKVSEVDSAIYLCVLYKYEQENDKSLSLDTQGIYASPRGCSFGATASILDVAADVVSCSSVTFKSSSLL